MSSLSYSYSSVCQTSGPKSVAFRVVFLSVAWPGPPCAALSGKASASDPYVSFFTRSWQGRGRRGGTQGLAWKAGASAADHAAPTRPPLPRRSLLLLPFRPDASLTWKVLLFVLGTVVRGYSRERLMCALWVPGHKNARTSFTFFAVLQRSLRVASMVTHHGNGVTVPCWSHALRLRALVPEGKLR